MKITLECDKPLAIDSADHTEPHGTAADNSSCLEFNRRLYALFPDRKPSVLDIGCSGGAFVKDCIQDGCVAVGLEGSDYSLLRKRAEWATIPDNLFVCDVTGAFQLLADGEPMRFDVITMWAFPEHIKEEDWPALMRNIDRHLAPGGIVIGSIANTTDGNWHVCIHPQPWWEEIFARHGFVNDGGLLAHFGGQFVRVDGGSFHVALKRQAPPSTDSGSGTA